MIYKLTVDGNITDAGFQGPGLETLKAWKEEGKIDLIETNPSRPMKPQPYGWPGAPPKTEAERSSGQEGHRPRSRRMNESGNANFKTVAASVYPGKDPHKLNMTEINNVAHLIQHHAAKHEIFITVNSRDLIEGGRRAILKAQFGIIVMTPNEAVAALNEMQGWNGKSEKPEKSEKKQR